MVFWEFCEMFWNSCFIEHFRMATFEIIWEGRRFLNKHTGCSSNLLTEKDLANKVFLKMLWSFWEHLIHFLTEASLENDY